MMKLSQTVFNIQLSKLRNHLDLLRKNSELYSKILEDEKLIDKDILLAFRETTEEKVFDFNAIVISLYGYWEHFFESSIKEFVEEIKLIGAINDTRNAAIKESYIESVKDALSNLKRSFRYKGISKLQLVDSSYNAYSKGEHDYIPQLFFQSGGNYNYTEIASSLHKLGFSDFEKYIYLYPQLYAFYESLGHTGASLKVQEVDVLFSRLNQVVNDRNRIAHGGENDSQIDRDSINEYVRFIHALSESLTLMFDDAIKEIKWEKNKDKEVHISQTYHEDCVGRLKRGAKCSIHLNQPVILKSTRGNYPIYRDAVVQSLSVDGVSCEEYNSDAIDKDVTFTLGMKIHKDSKILLI